MTEQCFYVPGEQNIIDTARADGTSTVFGHTLAQVQERYPGAVLMDFDAAYAEIEAGMRARYMAPPEPITEDRYEYWLNVLPPCGWNDGAFFVSEALEGRWHQHFARVGDRYYTAVREAALGSTAAFLRECQAMAAKEVTA